MFKKTKYIICCRFSFNLCEIEPESCHKYGCFLFERKTLNVAASPAEKNDKIEEICQLECVFHFV